MVQESSFVEVSTPLLPVSAHAETGNKPLSDSVDQTSINDEDDREVTQDERSEKKDKSEEQEEETKQDRKLSN